MLAPGQAAAAAVHDTRPRQPPTYGPGAQLLQKHGKQVTHSLHADVVYHISGSRHIAAALNTFGITKDTTDVLIARFAATGKPPTTAGPGRG